MKINGLIWLEDIVDKLISKHGVEQQEVREVLESQPHIRFVEKGHRAGENVYAAFGQLMKDGICSSTLYTSRISAP